MAQGKRSATKLVTASTGAMMLLIGAGAQAQNNERRVYHLPAEPLAEALRAVATLSRRPIAAPADLLVGKIAPPLDGGYTVSTAVAALLDGSGLKARPVADGFIVEKAAEAQAADADVVVTGSRIRGAPVASPVISLTQDSIRDAGQSTVAEAVASIPQNFGGGQNPGVGFNVPATSGVNVGSASSINLRGLGSDATLTLLDRHRLSYSASRQAIDVSVIPLGAVDRIEVVPDGASALYGSDAVAGVANIILKPDYDGIETSARIGTSIDGGDFEQRYGLTGGTRWASGGFIVAYEFGRTTTISGSDRSYTASQPSLTLLPGLRNDDVSLSAHQSLTPTLDISVDSLFNSRFSESTYSLDPSGDITASGARFDYRSRSFVIAPTARLRLGDSWRMFLTGSYGQDHTRYDVTSYYAGTAYPFPGNCYCNHAVSAELGGDGTLLHLPARPIKLALGGGYRSNTLVRFNGVGNTDNIARTQDSYYGYGELSVPLAAPEQHIRWVDRLSLSAALRYERYPGIGGIVTPKLGAIWAPTPDLDLKGSWGKSFRAPTLYQEYSSRAVVAVSPTAFGGTGYAADATAVLLQGGNPDLKPERATTWTATVDLHPRGIEGATLEISYFNVHYRDRIVTPIEFLSQALSNPIYAGRLTANPGSTLLSQYGSSEPITELVPAMLRAFIQSDRSFSRRGGE